MKKIAVIIRDDDLERQSEAVRVSLGLTICNDLVRLFIIDKELGRTEAVDKTLETLKRMKGKIYSNNKKNSVEHLSLENIAKELLKCDVIVPY